MGTRTLLGWTITPGPKLSCGHWYPLWIDYRKRMETVISSDVGHTTVKSGGWLEAGLLLTERGISGAGGTRTFP